MTIEPISHRTDIAVSLLVNGIDESAGRVIRLSETHMMIEGVECADRDTPIVVYLTDGTRFSGSACALSPDVVSVRLSGTRLTRMNVLKLMNRAPKLGLSQPQRRDERVSVDDGRSLGKRQDGRQFQCRIIDMSLTGLGIECDQALHVGEVISVGRVRGRIVRSTPTGYGLELLSNEDATREQDRMAFDWPADTLPTPKRATQSPSVFRPLRGHVRPDQ